MNYNESHYTVFAKHDKKVRDIYRNENGYPNILKCSGIPWYLAVREQLSDREYIEGLDYWIESWSEKAKKYKPIFESLKIGESIETANKDVWKITKIETSSFDNQKITLIDDKKKKYVMLLSDFLECMDRGAFILKERSKE